MWTPLQNNSLMIFWESFHKFLIVFAIKITFRSEKLSSFFKHF